MLIAQGAVAAAPFTKRSLDGIRNRDPFGSCEILADLVFVALAFNDRRHVDDANVDFRPAEDFGIAA